MILIIRMAATAPNLSWHSAELTLIVPFQPRTIVADDGSISIDGGRSLGILQRPLRLGSGHCACIGSKGGSGSASVAGVAFTNGAVHASSSGRIRPQADREATQIWSAKVGCPVARLIAKLTT